MMGRGERVTRSAPKTFNVAPERATSLGGKPGRREPVVTGTKAARRRLDGRQHLANGVARPGAEAEGLRGLARQETPQRARVRQRAVRDVDVVPDRGAVGGRVVVAQDRERPRAARGRVDGERDEVRLAAPPLADQPARIGSGRVEAS